MELGEKRRRGKGIKGSGCVCGRDHRRSPSTANKVCVVHLYITIFAFAFTLDPPFSFFSSFYNNNCYYNGFFCCCLLL